MRDAPLVVRIGNNTWSDKSKVDIFNTYAVSIKPKLHHKCFELMDLNWIVSFFANKLNTKLTFSLCWTAVDHLIKDVKGSFISCLSHSTGLLKQVYREMIQEKQQWCILCIPTSQRKNLNADFSITPLSLTSKLTEHKWFKT